MHFPTNVVLVTQGGREDDDESQSDVDDLKSGSDEQSETTSTKTHAIQGESEDNINPDEGTPNATDNTSAVQQTTNRYSGWTRRAPQVNWRTWHFTVML